MPKKQYVGMKIFAYSCIFAYFVAQVCIESSTVASLLMKLRQQFKGIKLQFKITISKKKTFWFLFFYTNYMYQSILYNFHS